MISQQRIAVEKQALDYGFPNRYVFQNLNSDSAFVDLGLRTNSGRTYRLKIILGDFPYSKPDVYVIYPTKLRDYKGKLLSEIPKKENTLVIMIQRGEQVIIPHGNIRLESGDMLVVSKTEI